MTIERVKGILTATCDGDRCTEYLESMTWLGIQDALKEEEWISRKFGDEWFHYCPGCARATKEAIQQKIQGDTL